MSVDKRRLDHDAQPGYGDERDDSLKPAGRPEYKGVRGRLKRQFDVWARLYVELRVEARTGRSH